MVRNWFLKDGKELIIRKVTFYSRLLNECFNEEKKEIF